MRRRPLSVLLAVLVVACGPPAGRLFHATLSSPDGSYPLRVTLGDQTDLVVAIEPAAGEALGDAGPSVWSEPAEPNVLIITWLGGACEDETVISFWPNDRRYGLMVAHRGGPGSLGGCPGIGLPRAVRVETSKPVPMELIDIIAGG